MMAEHAVPRLAPGVRLQEDRVRGRWMVQAPERMLLPDETALEVLRLLDGERTLGGIIDALAGRYAAPRAEIADDVAALLDDLADSGVVVA